MLSDLATLAPPLLMCAAFLVAVGAFIRHEMRHGDSPPREHAEESGGSPIAGGDQNQKTTPGAVPGHEDESVGRTHARAQDPSADTGDYTA